ncbi:type II secretion system protein [Candidatus Kaiserbacteria bacterium]|nr:type II secretion system protein [Candidatus Kaiserbacteria bacterium]
MNDRKSCRKKTSAGFTLIELLVVIAIIGMLASIILASLNTARVKSRDARRVADMNQMRNAIELYNDTIGHYPHSNGAWTSFDSPTYSPNPIVNPNVANLSTALSPYLRSIADPKSLGGDSGYLYVGNNDNYCILFWRTPEKMSNFSSNLLNPVRPTPANPNNIYTGIGIYGGGC